MKSKAFTMIEILVVVTIIGVLFGTAIISYRSLSTSSRDSRRKADLEQIRAALEMWRSSEPTANGTYPTYSGNCSNMNDGSITNFSDYLPQIPADPKEPALNYVCESTAATYTLYSTLETDNSGNQCDGLTCGSENCEYAVGPYGKTCGP